MVTNTKKRPSVGVVSETYAAGSELNDAMYFCDAVLFDCEMKGCKLCRGANLEVGESHCFLLAEGLVVVIAGTDDEMVAELVAANKSRKMVLLGKAGPKTLKAAPKGCMEVPFDKAPLRVVVAKDLSISVEYGALGWEPEAPAPKAKKKKLARAKPAEKKPTPAKVSEKLEKK